MEVLGLKTRLGPEKFSAMPSQVSVKREGSEGEGVWGQVESEKGGKPQVVSPAGLTEKVAAAPVPLVPL